MLSCGYSTPTPWYTPREISEVELGEKLERLAAQITNPARAVYNVHCPPSDTQLDQAPLLDEQLRPKVGAGGMVMHSVGSAAVRAEIEERQPLLGLHGHVHESTAAQKLGNTLCINPGSDYHHGILRSALIDLTPDGIGQWQLLQG
jgi:Icc-related predicted phosphoesterase